MPDHAPVPPRAHSLHRARALLLGAVATGLVGLALGGTGTPLAGPQVVSLASVTSPALEAAVPHAPTFAPPAPVVAPPRAVTAPKASRSRPVAKKPVVRKKKAYTGPEWVRPSRAGVISAFGMRWGRMHKGIDFGDSYGAPIRAIGAGRVIGAGYLNEESGYGQITLIQHADGIISAYAHQSRMVVHAGDRVQAGEVIGYVGSTGHVTGPHLHFEIRTAVHGGQISPLRWLRAHGVRI